MNRYFSVAVKKRAPADSQDSQVQRLQKPRESPSGPGRTRRTAEAQVISTAKLRKVELTRRFCDENNPSHIEKLFSLYKEQLLSNKETKDPSILAQSNVIQLNLADSFPTSVRKAVLVPKSVHQEFLDTERLYLRGGLSDSLILNTENKTYDVQVNPGSTTLMYGLINRGDKPNSVEISGTISNEICIARELEHVDMAGLKQLLSEHVLEWGAGKDSLTGYAHDALLRSVQMSEGQVMWFIRRNPVLNVDGQYMWMSKSFRDRLFDLLVQFLDDDDHPDILISGTGKSKLIEALREYDVPEGAAIWILDNMFEPNGEGGKHRAVEALVVQEGIRRLLHTSADMSAPVFEKLIDELIPCGMRYNSEYLRGVALLRPHVSGDLQVVLLDREELPLQVLPRIRALLAAQPLWSKAELEPYLLDMFPSKRQFEGFLVECMENTVDKNGIVVYGGVVDPDM